VLIKLFLRRELRAKFAREFAKNPRKFISDRSCT